MQTNSRLKIHSRADANKWSLQFQQNFMNCINYLLHQQSHNNKYNNNVCKAIICRVISKQYCLLAKL